jgi:hypothetical protein
LAETRVHSCIAQVLFGLLVLAWLSAFEIASVATWSPDQLGNTLTLADLSGGGETDEEAFSNDRGGAPDNGALPGSFHPILDSSKEGTDCRGDQVADVPLHSRRSRRATGPPVLRALS